MAADRSKWKRLENIPFTLIFANSGLPGGEVVHIIAAHYHEGGSLYCIWDWGDGNSSGWLGPYASEGINIFETQLVCKRNIHYSSVSYGYNWRQKRMETACNTYTFGGSVVGGSTNNQILRYIMIRGQGQTIS